MRYLDVKGLISYNLINEQEVLDKAGIEYYKAQVHKIALGIAEYENSIINIPYDLFLNDQISNMLNKTSLSIFLKLNEKDIILNDKKREESNKNTITLLAYNEFCMLLKEKANLDLECNNNIDETINKILELLKKINLSELKWI